MDVNPRELLSSALSFWWLRPENGLAIASYALRGMDLRPRPSQQSADYACGDGVNTFFKCGGRFTEDFDIFGKAVRRETAVEIAKNRIDVFDQFDEAYSPKIAREAECRYSYGTDHKENLLRKARPLNFYDRLIKADLQENAEQIADESLDLAYCNSLYWVRNSGGAVRNIYQKLKRGGLAVFDVMTTHRRVLNFERLFPTIPSEWQELMNRGRHENNPGIRSAREWREIFAAGGAARVEDERLILPSTIAHIWNFGLRPVFPVLNRMAAGLSEGYRLDVKREWVEIWTDLLLPVLLDPDEFMRNDLRIRLQYVIRKK
jgi:SAM-dependent methyltransferase